MKKRKSFTKFTRMSTIRTEPKKQEEIRMGIKTDIEIAQECEKRKITEIAAKAGDKEFERAEQRLKRALNRLSVSGKL